MARAGAHGAQHGQFTPAFVQPGQHHRHQRGQADQCHQARHGHQRALAQAHGRPQLVQRHAGQHGQQRLGLVVGDESLHVEHRHAVFQADQRGRHLPGFEIELARMLGRDLHPGRRRQRRTTGPVQVDGLYRLQADVYRAVHRRASAREHAHHGERLVGMLGGQIARRRTQAMREGDALAQRVAQGLRHLGAQHGLVQAVQRAGEGAALGHHQGLAVAIGKPGEVLRRGAQHRVAAVGVAQGHRHHPRHGAVRSHGAHAVHADVVGGPAHAENGVQHQLHRPRARADDEVGAADGLGKAAADVTAQPLQTQQQGGGQRNRQHHQRQRAAAVPGAVDGDVQEPLH